jgi:hypothetical protein
MNRAEGLAFSLSGCVLLVLLVLPWFTPILPSPVQPQPMLLAPMMDLTPCLLSESEASPQPAAPQGLLENCRGPQGSAADWVQATLSPLTPLAQAQPTWSWGYTLKVPLLNFVQQSPSGWQVDTKAIDKVVRTIEQTGKPLVLYLFSTHFSVNAPAEAELAKNPDNLAHTRDGPMPIDRYYGQPVYPWSVARLDNPITQVRETVIQALQERICAQPASVRQHIQAITLLGEVHHLYPAFESGMGFDGPYRISDYSAHSKSAFLSYLQGRYGTLDQLNKAMGSHFAQWSDITPPSKDIRQEKLQHFFEHLDSFASGRLPLTGWVQVPASGPLSRVHVFVNGRLSAQTPVSLSRQDVLEAKPELGHANVGWRHDLDFSKWPSGIHRIDLALSQASGPLHHLATRRVSIGNRQQSALEPVPMASLPHMEALPSQTQTHTDEPRELASYYFNPLAREWHAFRESQVQIYLQHFAQLLDKACLAQVPRYTHQIVPNFNPGWDAEKFAVSTSLQPQPRLHLGVSLYGETSYGPAFADWLRQHKHPHYGITEFHPLRPMSPQELSALFQRHQQSGSRFLSFFLDTPWHIQSGLGLNLFSMGPHNPKHSSDQFFDSLQQVLQSPAHAAQPNGKALPLKP